MREPVSKNNGERNRRKKTCGPLDSNVHTGKSTLTHLDIQGDTTHVIVRVCPLDSKPRHLGRENLT